ncbi:UDP-N-acetylmuramoyl-tripeptide--D-alanyl-D-alanine ligase [Rhodoluna sp.]|uniref:UDP-N-acetylmuramoyl-tripeptide--D-alanyl-D- alanine ligase n=1 Tax=Rhodoluna sp. TaxID=1969481 RepID=UPI0025E244A5|nr:UDP-N-acetylmuramoyl-tripeptide--D-alanyl-D-alanine ligase [Rhodoluna sp.]
MISISLNEIAEAVGGTVLQASAGDALVTGSVETDSRLVALGSLFVAKPGEVTDGHLFVSDAAQAGAVAAIVEREVPEANLPQIKVSDSVAALGLLAKHVLQVVRSRSELKVVGITGSNGKTTTKNMLREILSSAGETIAPIESFNNEVGAPISILKVTDQTKFLVVELGAGGEGSIRYLAQIAKPNIGVELKVGLAHVGEFGGIETTAKIKAELAEELGAEDLLILNADDGYVRDMQDLTTAKKIWFGTSADANYRATGQKLDITGTSFELHWPDSQVSEVKLQILGEHHVMNALAAAAVADSLGVQRAQIIAALQNMPLAERWRMQLMQRADGVAVINDAYNASPDSTKAALQTLAQLGKSGRRTIAVLGEMAELGESSREQHDAIGRIVVRLDINQLIVVGQSAKLIHMGAEQEGSWGGESKFFESIDEALAYLRGMLVAGDIVLVKSSKSANLRHLGDDLMEVSA